MFMNYLVYVLYSKKLNRYYVGNTQNLEDRLQRHNTGGSKYTSRGIPWNLVRCFECSTRSEAVRLERQIKARGINRYLEEN
ncbi:GIY-YIG nuclease family protein [Robiginitalea marina]|uniref:GIY-YIG nuclease family protein n=1 Tax=Robiginitalea marina TaxID=2954105 RepID=UPI003510D69F